MTRNQRAQTDENIGLKLTPSERTLLAEGLTGIPPKYARVIRDAAKSKPVVLPTLEEWEDLGRYIAAESDQSLEKTYRTKLDGIVQKIHDLVDNHADSGVPIVLEMSNVGQADSFEDDTVPLYVWLADAMGFARRFGVEKKPVENFPLDEAEREVVSKLITYPVRLRKKLTKPQAAFTVGEVGDISQAISTSLRRPKAIPDDLLMAVLHKLTECLDEEISAADAAIPRRKAKPTSRLFQFKVTLDGIDPPIWRRIQTTDCTLSDLHEIIQAAMGWENYHMHQFIVNGVHYGAKEAIEFGMEHEDDNKVRLNQIIPNQGKKKFRFQYDYDFGDGWVHEITFEESPEPESRAKYPRCIDGARSGPPEDSGGIWGYQEFLEALADPNDEQYDERLEWMRGWDAERFSIKEINKALRQFR